jgi:hypothetical protein
MIFHGTYNSGLKLEGKEYIDDKLIFEGEYKDGKKWNGRIKESSLGNHPTFEIETGLVEGTKLTSIIKIYNDYDDKSKYEFEYLMEIERWKGNVYRNYSNQKLSFEIEYTYDEQYIIKEYNSNEKLIFDGEYKDGKKYKGKEYNKDGILIFD